MDNSNQERIEIKLQRQLNRLVLPILLETLLTFLLGGVDTFMLSQHSDDAVAAVGMDNQILQLVFLLFTIINAGTSVLCSQYFGAKLQDRFIKVSGVALMLNLTIGLMSSLMLFLFAEPVLLFMGLRPELMVYGKPYLQIVGSLAFAQAITTTISAILRASNKPIYPMIVIVVVNILNIIGNYTLIFGKFGMPALGAEGAAISTSISRTVSMFGMPALGAEGAAISTSISRTVSMLMLIVMLNRKLIPSFPLQLFRPFPFSEMRKLLKIGLPSAGENISYNLQQLTIIYFINMIGNEALTARIYVGNVVMFVYLYAICIAQGSSIMVGHLTGVEKTQASYVIGKFAWHRGAVITLTFSVLCALAGPFIAGSLTDNEEISTLVCWCYLIDVLLEVGKCINIWATNTLRATGDIFFPFYLGIIVQWLVGVGFGYLFGIVFGFGLIGMWFAFVLDENIRGAIFVSRWNSFKWANKGFVK